MKNKKRLLCIALISVLTVSANAQQYAPESDFSAKIINNGRGVEIIKYTGSQQTVNIPPMMEEIPVTSIGREAFSDNTSLTSVTIPDSVINIGERTFWSCTSLTNITIGNRVTGIWRKAFQNCASLTSVIIPSSVTEIGTEAFFGCTGLISVTFQGRITAFGFNYNGIWVLPFHGDLRDKYFAGGIGTYKTTAPVSEASVWRKQ
jgi:hypothetical protein